MIEEGTEDCFKGNYKIYDDKEGIDGENNVIYYESPIGLLEIQSNGGELIGLNFIEGKREEKRCREKAEAILIEAKRQLDDYFNGNLKVFDLPLKMAGSRFQHKVWQELLKIPYGETLSYKGVAAAIGNENACRAVGNANNKNNIAIIIPCHRVVGSNGRMVGYGAGVWRKEWLLEHERRHR